MNENAISKLIVDAAYQIHVKLGPGLLENVYEVILAHELRKLGLTVQRQEAVPLKWDNIIFDESYRVDLLINNLGLVEIKSVEKTASVHKRQLLTYLKVREKRLGLLLNFGEDLIKNGIHRVVNGLPE
jgi:GxxExxY protein